MGHVYFETERKQDTNSQNYFKNCIKIEKIVWHVLSFLCIAANVTQRNKNKQMKTNYKPTVRVCMWCEIGQTYFTKIIDVSHGLCEHHYQRELKKIAQFKQQKNIN